MSLDYTSKEEGFKYEIQLMKEGQSKKSKVTAKKHLEEVKCGEIFIPEGASVSHKSGSHVVYFTGKPINILYADISSKC